MRMSNSTVKKHLAIVLVLTLIVSAFARPVEAKSAAKPKVTGTVQIDAGGTGTITVKANGLVVKDVKAFPIGECIDVSSVSKSAVKVKGLSSGTGKVRVFVTAKTKANKKKKIKATTQIYAYFSTVIVMEGNPVGPDVTPVPTATPGTDPAVTPTATPETTVAPTPEITPTPAPEIPSGPSSVEINCSNTNVTATCSAGTVNPGDKFTVSLVPKDGYEFGDYGKNVIPYPTTFQASYEKKDGGVGLVTYLQVKKKDLFEKTFTVPEDIAGGSKITVKIS